MSKDLKARRTQYENILRLARKYKDDFDNKLIFLSPCGTGIVRKLPDGTIDPTVITD